MDTLAADKPYGRTEVRPSRRRITADELLRMAQAGIIGDSENVELIDGEIVLMAPKGNRHEIVRSKLMMYFGRARPDSVGFSGEAPIRLDDYNEPEPDFSFFPVAIDVPDVRGGNCLLAIEVSDSSLGWDLSGKAALYASFGVAEYWVVDVNRLITHVHRQPSGDRFAIIDPMPTDARLTPLNIPTMTLCLRDFGFAWDEAKPA